MSKVPRLIIYFLTPQKVPFLVDKKKKQEEIGARKKLKAKRNLTTKKKQFNEEEGESTVGQFVRAPALENSDSDDALDPINLGKGLKRQLSDDDSDYEEPRPATPRKIVLAPSAFSKKPIEAMDQEQPWQVVSKKKKLKAMDVDASAPNNFRNKLVDSLKGGRFRFLNEQLYKCESQSALRLFETEGSEAFKAYHEGYRQQVSQWPYNPLNRIIKSIQKLPIKSIVVDFGCGEARLAQVVPQEVISIDLVAAAPAVIACDMAHTPLKAETADVAVFCLSLMGTNLKDFLIEANRVLKPRGTLKIAEVASRFDNVKFFIKNVEACGFQLTNQDLNDKLFYYFNFKKSAEVEKATLKSFSLKPCLYKKR